MAADIPPEAGALGVKLASLVAGFAGGVVSLSFVRELTQLQAVLAVLTGSLCAGYLTPVMALYLPAVLPEPTLAFLVGLTSMNLIPGILHLSDRFRTDPGSFGKGGEQ